MPVATGAVCAQHPQAQAVEICTRCGVFVCATCLQFRDNAVLCPTCHGRFMGKASTRAVLSLVLGIIGFNCLFLPGVVGLVLAIQELGAIDRGEAPEAGRSIATGGKVIGFINLGILVLGLGAAAIAVLFAIVKR